MKKYIFTSVILLAILSSCMVGKKYSRPEMPASATWETQSKYINTPDSIGNLKWFQIFNDNVLNSLIDTALKYNYYLASAAARIEQARAAYGIAKADMLTSVGYDASAKLNSATSNDFRVMATASWEIDFFGKLRHAKKAAYAEILASEASYDESIALLKEAVEMEDKLNYNEPPDWFFSVRHHLGAIQIEAGKYTDAITTFEENLKRLPKNGWAYNGMKLAYSKKNDTNKVKEMDQMLAYSWATADIELSNSRIKTK